jgi:predicted SAM-dependent methyltransferase
MSTSLLHKIVSRVRWELSMRYGILSDGPAIKNEVLRRQRNQSPIFLNLGCGTCAHSDWVNIDFRGDGDAIFSWDLRKQLPLDDQSCDVIYASHVLEHFDCDAARKLLLECRRLLRPGGCIRLVVPDLEAIARAYLLSLDEARLNKLGAASRHKWMTIELLDQLVRHQSGGEMMKYWSQDSVPEESFIAERVGAEYTHARKFCMTNPATKVSSGNAKSVGKFRLGGEVHLWMYDDFSLASLLQDCGFINPATYKASESSIKGFVNFHLDTLLDGSARKPDSFFIEAFVV